MQDKIHGLLKKTDSLNSRIHQIEFDEKIADTKSNSYCYCIKIDGNGNHRQKDLVEYLTIRVLEYAIPRRIIKDADESDRISLTHEKILEAQNKAKSLFNHLQKSGEGGELLLYVLVEDYLRLPQLIGKMSLKTSSNMHYQGADGIHFGYDATEQKLHLYWGESKIYKEIDQATQDCFESLSKFLTDEYSNGAAQSRDLDLVTANITNMIGDDELEKWLVRYFDRNDDVSNSVIHKGVCLIGFDFDKYPPHSSTTKQLVEEISDQISSWKQKLKTKINIHKLANKEIHIFLMPMPSVEDFRNHFNEWIKK